MRWSYSTCGAARSEVSMHFYYLGSRNEDAWVKLPSGLYQAADDILVRVKDEYDYHYTFSILPGFVTDGGSVPKVFRWFVPSWSGTNHVINLAYACHDGVYATACMPRLFGDDLLRGMLRDAGLSRARASSVCWAVNNFACRHYGPEYDHLGSGPFFRMTKYKI